MFKKTFTKIVAIMAVTFGVSFVTPVVDNYVNQTTVVNADASTLASDGPWEQTSDENNMLQQLHNGNEIYYSIAPNDENKMAFQNAVNDWNALGVIKLVQVTWGDSQSQITMQSTNTDATTDSDNTYAETSFPGLHGDSTHSIIGVATIKTYNEFNDASTKTQSVVADHELGHALGFAHDNRKIKSNGKKYRNYRMTMNEYGSHAHYYKLGGIEQHMLEDHYNLTASVDLSNMNC